MWLEQQPVAQCMLPGPQRWSAAREVVQGVARTLPGLVVAAFQAACAEKMRADLAACNTLENSSLLGHQRRLVLSSLRDLCHLHSARTVPRLASNAATASGPPRELYLVHRDT